MFKNHSRAVALGLAACAGVYAHYTWVAPGGGALEVGKAAVIRICHGHHFPEGEEKISITGAMAMVMTPSGARHSLTPTAAGNEVTTPYTPKEGGLHRVVYVQDRGVSSRTPAGVKPGGRDKNPDAAQASRTYRSAVAYLPVGKSGNVDAKAAGIEVEIAGKLQLGGAWDLELSRNGKPEAGVAIQVFIAGAHDPAAIGKTDSSGKLSYKPAAGVARPLLFWAEWKATPPAGAPYDTINYSTSLYVTQ